MTSWWEVSFRLNHKFSDVELAYWPDLFNSPDCKVTEENGNHWLAACRFEKLTLEEVRESARKLLTMMTAFAKIELGTDFQSIERDDEDGDVVAGIREHVNDRINATAFPKTAKMYSFAFPPKPVVQDKDGNVIKTARTARMTRTTRPTGVETKRLKRPLGCVATEREDRPASLY